MAIYSIWDKGVKLITTPVRGRSTEMRFKGTRKRARLMLLLNRPTLNKRLQSLFKETEAHFLYSRFKNQNSSIIHSNSIMNAYVCVQVYVLDNLTFDIPEFADTTDFWYLCSLRLV